MSTKRILALGAVAGVVYLGLSYGLRTAFPRIKVGYDTVLAGRITGAFQNSGQRSFFLDGHSAPRYDFDAFDWVAAAVALRARQKRPEDNSLSQYLRKGDLVRKLGRATVLTVQRGDSLTQWVCMP